MNGNVIGNLFKVTTFGESHGPAIGCIVDGCPPGMELTQEDIQRELDRRRPGQSKVSTSRSEPDRCEILSGVYDNVTTGTPIAIIIKNRDADPRAYEAIKHVYRPGHADYTYIMRYGIRDHRGGGRSSGRETAARVAAGAVAKTFIDTYGMDVFAHTTSIGDVVAGRFRRAEIERNPVRCADAQAAILMAQAIVEAQEEGDSLGGLVEVVAKNVPPGLGEPVFSKLDAELAGALMSIGAVKGVEFGAGFKAAKMRGSEMNDPIVVKNGKVRMPSNRAGGVLGGISTGEDIIMRIAVKPTPSIKKSQRTVGMDLKKHTLRLKGRHDPCICPRIVPVAEAMTSIVLADHLLKLLAISDE